MNRLLVLFLCVSFSLSGSAQVKIQPMNGQADRKELYKKYPPALERGETATLRDMVFDKITADYWNDFRRFLRKNNFRPDTSIVMNLEGFFQPDGRADLMTYQYSQFEKNSIKPSVQREQTFLRLLSEFLHKNPLPVTSTLVWSPFRLGSYVSIFKPGSRKIPRGPGIMGDLASAQQTNRPDTVKKVAFTGLDLERVPDVLYRFVNAEEIDLGNNYLTALPAKVTTLPNLKRLNLMANRLTEDSVFFTRNTNLLSINIQKNSLTSIPKSVRQNRRLESLWLGNNDLADVTMKPLIGLRQLNDLNLYNAGLTRIPRNIKRLKHLTVLDLYYNKFTELPRQLGRLKRLEQLALSHNTLTELPAGLTKLRQLQQLYIHHNQLSQLPASMGKLSKLRVLNISNNAITVVPPVLATLPALEELNLGRNNIQELPIFLSTMTRLKRVFLRANPITEQDAIAGPYAPVIKRMEANKTEVLY